MKTKYVLKLIGFFVLGGIVGLLLSSFDGQFAPAWQAVINTGADFAFLGFIPLTVLLIYAYCLFNKVKKAYQPDMDDMDALDKYLDNALTIASTTLIIGFVLLAFSAYDLLARGKDFSSTAKAIGSAFGHITLSVVSTVLQYKVVEFAKRIYPKKRGNVLDKNFQKEWLNSCDEREIQLIGNAAYQAYSAGVKSCLITIVLALCLSMLGLMSPVSVLFIAIVWYAMSYAYYKACSHNKEER